jgi:hypothetical protein
MDDWFQTKDMFESMSQFYISNGFLFLADNTPKDSFLFDSDTKTLQRTTTLTMSSCDEFTGTAVIYSHCQDCEPVFIERKSGMWGSDLIIERRPSEEFKLEIELGQVLSVTRVTTETNESISKEVVSSGGRVLPIDHHLVQSYLYKLEM